MSTTKKIQIDEFHRVFDTKQHREVTDKHQQELADLMASSAGDQSRVPASGKPSIAGE